MLEKFKHYKEQIGILSEYEVHIMRMACLLPYSYEQIRLAAMPLAQEVAAKTLGEAALSVLKAIEVELSIWICTPLNIKSPLLEEFYRRLESQEGKQADLIEYVDIDLPIVEDDSDW